MFFNYALPRGNVIGVIMTSIESSASGLEQAKALRQQEARKDLQRDDARQSERIQESRKADETRKTQNAESVAKDDARREQIAADLRQDDRVDRLSAKRGENVDINV